MQVMYAVAVSPCVRDESISLHFPAATSLTTWWLSASTPSADTVSLNGKNLTVDLEAPLPSLDGVAVTGSTTTLPGSGVCAVGFVEAQYTNNIKACGTSTTIKSDDDSAWATAVEHDATQPTAAFAARDITAALNAAELPASAGWRVVLTADAPPLELGGADWPSVDHPEGYAIRCLPAHRVVAVVGGGRSGAMYGGLRVAELLRCAATTHTPPCLAPHLTAHSLHSHQAAQNPAGAVQLASIPNITVSQPLLETRGLKMNVPLDARTPSYGDAGDSAQHNVR